MALSAFAMVANGQLAMDLCGEVSMLCNHSKGTVRKKAMAASHKVVMFDLASEKEVVARVRERLKDMDMRVSAAATDNRSWRSSMTTDYWSLQQWN